MNNLDNFVFEVSADIDKDYDGPMTWVKEGDKLILKKGCIYEQNENKREKNSITLEAGEDVTWANFLRWMQGVHDAQGINGAMPDVPKELLNEKRIESK